MEIIDFPDNARIYFIFLVFNFFSQSFSLVKIIKEMNCNTFVNEVSIPLLYKISQVLKLSILTLINRKSQNLPKLSVIVGCVISHKNGNFSYAARQFGIWFPNAMNFQTVHKPVLLYASNRMRTRPCGVHQPSFFWYQFSLPSVIYYDCR